MKDELEHRLEKIESTIANLENLHDKLNEVVIEQGKAIRKLQVYQQRLAQTMESIESDRVKADRSKPPHYQ